jgi:hypothetical protein
MAAVATYPTALPVLEDNTENMAALLFLIALFQEKGDISTATRLIETLQNYS